MLVPLIVSFVINEVYAELSIPKVHHLLNSCLFYIINAKDNFRFIRGPLEGAITSPRPLTAEGTIGTASTSTNTLVSERMVLIEEFKSNTNNADLWEKSGTGFAVHKRIVITAAGSLFYQSSLHEIKPDDYLKTRITTAQNKHVRFEEHHVSKLHDKVHSNLVVIITLQELTVTTFELPSQPVQIVKESYLFTFLTRQSPDEDRTVRKTKLALQARTDLTCVGGTVESATHFYEWWDSVGAPVFADEGANQIVGLLTGISRKTQKKSA